ncbi:MAG TPA: POTRA domain-containing protein [Kofleriaceae bacterium]|nr:POTRA domain-containing protein [Kofleriaceae bacterium]
MLVVCAWVAVARAQPRPTTDVTPPPGTPSPAPAPAPAPASQPTTPAPPPPGTLGTPATPLPSPGPPPTSPLPSPIPPAGTTPVPTVAPVAEPPAQWTRWEIAGTLIDSPARVRALLDGAMRRHRALTADARTELTRTCERLGYHLVDLAIDRPAPGEVVATLRLEPIVMVRWVDVKLSQRFYDVLLDDEVRRRMRLRTGVYLPADVDNLKKQLATEQERIETYLRDEGFFEAVAHVTEQAVGRYGARIRVRAKLGPSYRVGKVNVVNAGATGTGLAISEDDIAKEFHHGWACVLGRCRFTRAQLQADLERVTRRFQKRGYPAARVQSNFDPRTSFDRASKRVTFTVSVDPRRKIDVVFEGNDKDAFSDELLTNQLTFGAATSADDIEVAASARAIEALYQSRGYLDVIVTSERVRLRAFDRVIYRIESGPARTVKTVEFACRAADGVSTACSVPLADLQGAVGTRPATSFRLFAAPVFPTREQLQADVAGLERLYRSRGYLAAKASVSAAPRRSGWASAALSAAEVAGEVAPHELAVLFQIDEGPRTVIDDIEIVFEGGAAGGRRAGDEARIRERLHVHVGDPYLKDNLDTEAQALKDWYWSLGRPRAAVTVEVRPGSDDHHVVVVFNIEEKQELHLGEVVIRGNFRTRDWVIRDQLGFDRGALLTAGLQTSGLRRLRSTNLFNGVAFDLINFDDPRETTVDVVVKVEERYDLLARMDLEGGYSQLNGAFLRAHPVMPNLGGLGIKLDTQLTLGTEYQSADTSLRLPRWLLPGWARFDTEVAAFIRNQVTERFGDLRSLGGSLAAVRTWERAHDAHHTARLVTAALRYDVRQLSRDEDAIRPAGLAESIEQNPIQTRTGTVGVTLDWDTRRDASGNLNPLAPARGYRLQGGLSVASPWLLGQDTFLKVSGLGQVFWTAGRFQLRADTRYDQGIPLDNSVLLPEVERFYAGGDDTVRGFEEDRLATELVAVPVPPLDGGCDPSNPSAGLCQVRLLPAGGNIRALATLDAQVTLWQLFGIPIASAVFTDAGVVTNTWAAVKPGSIRPSAGMALRWLLPIGALSIEYALPLEPRLGDNPRGRFHLAVALRY